MSRFIKMTTNLAFSRYNLLTPWGYALAEPTTSGRHCTREMKWYCLDKGGGLTRPNEGRERLERSA